MRTIELTSDLLIPGQGYLIEAQKKHGFKVVEHDRRYPNTSEKAKVLGVPRERLVKAIFFGYETATRGVIAPDQGKIDAPKLFNTGGRMLSGKMPKGFVRQGCGPFVTEAHLEGGLELFIHEDGELKSDVDVGLGSDERYSLQMPYGLISVILQEAHPTRYGTQIKVVKVPFIEHPGSKPFIKQVRCEQPYG